MYTIDLSAGIIEYEDTGGNGPVVVLLHGPAMNGSVWRHVVDQLRADYRCVVPTMPMGGHQHPMRASADLSSRGIARLLVEFLQALDLCEVTLVGNDAGAFLFAAGEHPERLKRLVITSCEAFENFPPGLPGRALALAAHMPGGLYMLAQTMRVRALRRLPLAFGWMAKHRIPHEVTDAWLRPLITQSQVRRDLSKYVRSSGKHDMFDAAEGLRTFDRPALVIWAREDRVMPAEHGRRLAALLPHARVIEIADSYTLLPQDQPGELARVIHQFIQDSLNWRGGEAGQAGGSQISQTR